MKFVEPIRDKRKIELVKVILKKNDFRDYMLFLMGINSGLRISDILKLKVSDLQKILAPEFDLKSICYKYKIFTNILHCNDFSRNM